MAKAYKLARRRPAAISVSAGHGVTSRLGEIHGGPVLQPVPDRRCAIPPKGVSAAAGHCPVFYDHVGSGSPEGRIVDRALR